jgi:transporter family protein
MSWILLAIIAAVLMGSVNLIDKIIPSKFSERPTDYPLSIGILGVPVSLILLAIIIPFSHISMSGIFYALLSGGCFGIFACICLRLVYKYEASRIFPLVHMNAVFTGLIAFFFIGEKLTILQWLSIAIIVFGAMILSITKSSPKDKSTFLIKLLLLMVVATITMGFSNTFLKLAVTEGSVVITSTLRVLVLYSFLVILNSNKASWNQMKRWWNTKPRTAFKILAFNEGLATTALMLIAWAAALGPISLVTVILSTSILITVISALIIGKFSNTYVKEQPGQTNVIIKLIGSFLILGGVIIISII